ncbi:MAG: hypothetical protein ACYTEW_24470 [Planctomycetota bacterium]|jgi:hypothetical protein
MAIDDTITTLTNIYQSIDQGIPKTATSPDALVNHLNDLYSESTQNRNLDGLFESDNELYSESTQNRNIDELFAYDDVGSPSITLTVSFDVEFDLKRVMENMRTRLHTTQHGQVDEIGKTGIVWSHGRYDFMYDGDPGLLRISHKYSHKREDTKSVLSIIKRMIGYAKDYLEEVKKSAEESTSTPETE